MADTLKSVLDASYIDRNGGPEDIAALTAFLAGKESGFITGAEFIVDGGVTRKMIYSD